MDRVRAELERVKASKSAMAEERARCDPFRDLTPAITSTRNRPRVEPPHAGPNADPQPHPPSATSDRSRSSRLMADALPDDETELEDMAWRGDRGRGEGSQTAETASPLGSLTDDELNPGPGPSREPGGGATFAPERPADTDAAPEDEILVPLSGINDDGYFGDASGQWLHLQPNEEITFVTRGEHKTFTEEVRDFWKTYGTSFLAGLVSVVVVVVVLILWGSYLERKGAVGRRLLSATDAHGGWGGGAVNARGGEAWGWPRDTERGWGEVKPPPR